MVTNLTKRVNQHYCELEILKKISICLVFIQLYRRKSFGLLLTLTDFQTFLWPCDSVSILHLICFFSFWIFKTCILILAWDKTCIMHSWHANRTLPKNKASHMYKYLSMSHCFPTITDYRHPERAFFQKLKTFGPGQTNWDEILCGIGVFLAKL